MKLKSCRTNKGNFKAINMNRLLNSLIYERLIKFQKFMSINYTFLHCKY